MSEFRNNTLWLSGPKISHEGLKSEELMEMPQECLSKMRKEGEEFSTAISHSFSPVVATES